MAPRNDVGYVVRLSEAALIGMILNGLEAYVVNHSIKGGFVETYGCLLGYQSLMRDRRTLYQVEMANIDTSAERRHDGVKFLPDAIALKAGAVHSFWPHLEYLGDFHTHPYEDCGRVRTTRVEDSDTHGDNKGFFFSEGDKESLAEFSDYYEENNIDYRVGLAMTIAALKGNKAKEAAHVHSNCIAFNLKGYRMWITAYCAYHDDSGTTLRYSGNRDSSVFLECQSLVGSIDSFI